MKKEYLIMKRLNEMVLPLCIYYLAGSAVSTVGTAFLESKKEIFTGQIILGTKAEVLFAGLLRILIYLCSALSIYGYYKKESALSEREEGNPQKEITGFFIQNRILRKVGIFLLGAVLAILFNLLWARLPFFAKDQVYQEVVAVQYSFPLWLGLILYGLASPFAEEVMFRGIYYRMGKRYFGKTASVLISACVFGLFHGNIVQASYGILMGIFLAVVYEREGDLTSPFLFHAGANIVAYSLKL